MLVEVERKEKDAEGKVVESERDNTEEQTVAKAEANSTEMIEDKLNGIPVEKLRDIIRSQIDLEIRLKHRELTLVKEEIGKCESQMITLRKFFEIDPLKQLEQEPNDFTRKYHDLLNKSMSARYSLMASTPDVARGSTASVGEQGEPKFTYRTRSTTSSLRPSSAHIRLVTSMGCLYRRTDGVVVKLTCPDCQRSNFSSAQGFLNHSRIAHAKEYTSQDGAALQCGEILPESEQDEEGLASLGRLRDKGLDPSKNLNVNEIYFDGLSNSLNTVHRIVADKPPTPPSTLSPDADPHARKDSELMRKLLRSGVAKDESDYHRMIDDARNEIDTPHLFADEEEVIAATASDSPPASVTHDSALKPKSKHRNSRSSVTVAPSYATNDHSSPSSTPDPPLPKIKLKIKNPSAPSSASSTAPFTSTKDDKPRESKRRRR